MVALKPCLPPSLSLEKLGKQERRGGIETHSARRLAGRHCAGSRNAVVALKPATIAAVSFSNWRSRNAVVALKLDDRREEILEAGVKQERRGGIETSKGRGTTSRGRP